jgi:lysophospholipase L1-like esterase
MRILMLGNSFTFANDMPDMLAELLNAEVVHHTRGGAHLAEQFNPDTEMGAKTLAALTGETWDYVVLQEYSTGPLTGRERFLQSVEQLCQLIRRNGACPILYATWAYRKDCDKLEEMGLEYDVMAAQLSEAYHEAADQNEALIAEVGKRFYEQAEKTELYADDGKHPSEAGSKLAAETIAAVIAADQEKKKTAAVCQEISEKVGDNDTRLRKRSKNCRRS